MQFLLDHLSSLLVASSVLLLTIIARTDSSQLAIEQTSHYSARAQVQVFTGWMQRDLTTIGENFGSGEATFTMPVQSTSGRTAGMTTRFEFSRDSLRTAGGTTERYRVFVRYRLIDQGEVTVDNEPSPVPLFGLERDEQIIAAPTNAPVSPSPGGWTRAGGGPGTLSQFRIIAQDRDGRVVTVRDQVDFLQLRLSFVPPFDNEKRELHELHWGTTLGIRPF